MLIPATEDGRILFTVSSPHQGTLWMTSLEIFTTVGHELLTSLGDISGVGNVSYQFELGEDESILVTSSEDITNGVNLESNTVTHSLRRFFLIGIPYLQPV